MDALQNLIDGFIDFEGQKRAEQLCNVLLVLTGVIAYVVGFVLQDLTYTVYIGLGGTALTMLAVVPPWPAFKKNPVTWLPAGTTEVEEKKEQ
ncbi:microsomal signal peptidase 12 kDa subunit [Ascodesmis nigricans]|uniref:Signal peptidase complex subunit 1 n=1 Tax=Ascodesmis nigricans TaxID=341454 RepID=A0A4S2N6V8_9PEZI|nr:microsomal signal peptidase 12 kDa subunit [Ascodesmis nigricans]